MTIDVDKGLAELERQIAAGLPRDPVARATAAETIARIKALPNKASRQAEFNALMKDASLGGPSAL